ATPTTRGPGAGTQRPPVVRGGLHHDPLDPLADQTVGQLHDRGGGRGNLPTVVTRLPALASCGTRVQTMPDALPTSTAATRARISSCSSTSTCRPVAPTLPSSPHRRAGRGVARGSVGTETLTGVLEATVRDPSTRAPAPGYPRPPTTKNATASAGNPPHFHAGTAPPQRGHGG